MVLERHAFVSCCELFGSLDLLDLDLFFYLFIYLFFFFIWIFETLHHKSHNALYKTPLNSGFLSPSNEFGFSFCFYLFIY